MVFWEDVSTSCTRTMVASNTLHTPLQRGSTSIATLLQKVAAHQRSLSRHTPSCGSCPCQCSGGPVGDLIFTSSVLLGFVAVLRTRRDSPSQVGACPLVCSLLASCHFYAFH